jgi:hypothetical protein
MARMYTKSAAAFALSFDILRKITEGPLYFWTFTAEDLSHDVQFCWAWKIFMRLLNHRYRGSVCGLRVFERHVGDGLRHGRLHAHVVCNRYLRISELKRLARNTGIGQVMWVKKAWDGLDDYLSKYMTKEGRLRGVRQWAAFGHWDHCPVSRVIVESEEANLYRSVAAQLKLERQTHIWTKTKGLVEQILRERHPEQYKERNTHSAFNPHEGAAASASGNPF